MKLRNYFGLGFSLLPAAFLVVAPISARSQEEPPGARPPDSPLHKEMEAINRNQRKLSRQIADPAQKASSLELVGAMQKSAETAKTLVPPQAEKLSEAEKAKYLALYAKDMDALAKELASVKDAIASDKADVAKEELDKLMKLKESSHKELDVREHRGGGGRGPGGPRGPGGRPGSEGPGNPPANAPQPEATP